MLTKTIYTTSNRAIADLIAGNMEFAFPETKEIKPFSLLKINKFSIGQFEKDGLVINDVLWTSRIFDIQDAAFFHEYGFFLGYAKCLANFYENILASNKE